MDVYSTPSISLHGVQKDSVTVTGIYTWMSVPHRDLWVVTLTAGCMLYEVIFGCEACDPTTS
jgi:hypothetical protein